MVASSRDWILHTGSLCIGWSGREECVQTLVEESSSRVQRTVKCMTAVMFQVSVEVVYSCDRRVRAICNVQAITEEGFGRKKTKSSLALRA
jgi:hypothetical protein